MLNFSYTLTTTLKRELERAEETRNNILLTVISPRDELRIRWEANLNHIQSCLQMREIPLSKDQLSELFKPQSKKKLSLEEQEAIHYRAAFDYITQNWLVSHEFITPQTLLHLHHIFEDGKLGVEERDIRNSLDFIQINPEHPIIQAGLATILFLHVSSFTDKYIRLSQLLSMLFMYKHGYDFRGLLNLEEYFQGDQIHYLELIRSAKQEGNVSAFLEYFTQAVSIQAEKAYKKLHERSFEIHMPDSYYELSLRQKEIVSYLEQPGTRITNRDVQKQFKVSQITASRDLAKLASLGLIFPMGKGRSVYYTKT